VRLAFAVWSAGIAALAVALWQMRRVAGLEER
jgi:hypothetical protein